MAPVVVAIHTASRWRLNTTGFEKGPHLETILLAQDAGVDGLDDGILIKGEVQGLRGTAGRQQGLMGMGLLEALHQASPAMNIPEWDRETRKVF